MTVEAEDSCWLAKRQIARLNLQFNSKMHLNADVEPKWKKKFKLTILFYSKNKICFSVHRGLSLIKGKVAHKNNLSPFLLLLSLNNFNSLYMFDTRRLKKDLRRKTDAQFITLVGKKKTLHCAVVFHFSLK